jgi:hypothetical protein
MMKLRSQYNYDYDQASDETALLCQDPSLTRQSEAEEADINTIVRRFGVTGVLPEVPRPPVYADFTDHVNDFQTAQNLVISAQRSFAKLSGEVRQLFHDDPAEWVDFAATASPAELAAYGVKTAPEGATAQPPATATPPAPPPSGGAGVPPAAPTKGL